jgi:DNA-binding transcriptional regulator YhcF (GntR family)
MDKKPIYRVIADKVAESIIKGDISEHSKLPSVRKLANEYGVSNLTALNAMRLLENELVVYAIPKKAYFVKTQQQNDHIQPSNFSH